MGSILEHKSEIIVNEGVLHCRLDHLISLLSQTSDDREYRYTRLQTWVTGVLS